MKWLRLYTEIVDDLKIKRLSDKEFRHFIYLLCVAAQEEKDGLIPCHLEDIAWRLRDSPQTVGDSVEKLKSLGILADNGEGQQIKQ